MSGMLRWRSCASSPSLLELLLRRRSRPPVPRTALQIRSGTCMLVTARISCRHAPNGCITEAAMGVFKGYEVLHGLFTGNI